MMHRVSYGLLAILITFVFTMPLVASADRQSEILKEIAQIFEQIKLLQAQLDAIATNPTTPTYATTQSTNTSPASGGSCPVITRNLGIGSEGADVTDLQRYLAQDKSVYPEGVISGYFGSLTQIALQRWQASHGIVSSGTADTTGFGAVGPRTRNAIKNCGDSVPNSFGALMQVSPTSGAVPLNVSAKITVNTSKSCSRATYNLDFGDGSASTKITVPENYCKEFNQNVSHTYDSAGIYNVTLGIGNNKTSLSVTVSEGIELYNQPSVMPSRGPAPLLVQAQATFKAQSCSSPPYKFQTFRMNFGDGTVEDVYIQNASIVPTDCGRSITKSVSHTYSTSGTYAIVLEEVGPDSTGASSILSSLDVGTVEVSGESSTVSSGIVIGTYSVYPSSGTAPLNVSARFTHGLCSEAESWRLDWGDGISTQETLIRADASSVSCTAVLANRIFTHTYGQAGTYSVRFYKGGGDVNTAPLVGTRVVIVSQ
jgi:PKD repeat protein